MIAIAKFESLWRDEERVEGQTGVRPKGLASESVTKHRRWQAGQAGEGAAHQNCDLGQLVSYK